MQPSFLLFKLFPAMLKKVHHFTAIRTEFRPKQMLNRAIFVETVFARQLNYNLVFLNVLEAYHAPELTKHYTKLSSMPARCFFSLTSVSSMGLSPCSL